MIGPNDLDLDEDDEVEEIHHPVDPTDAARPSVGVILGVSLMLLGIMMVGLAIVGPKDRDQVDAAGTPTSTTEPSAIAPGLAPGTTAPMLNGELGVGFAPKVAGRSALRGFGEASITVTSGEGRVCELCVLSAITVEQRERGLMAVTDVDLGGYDGMLFEFPEEVEGSFWMRNTPTPLSIAYFDNEGKLVSVADMAPCDDSIGCPSYPAKGPFRFALEVPQGSLVENGVDGAATLRIESRTCPI